jgi:protein involved in polysaccharide export with SLBB domain
MNRWSPKRTNPLNLEVVATMNIRYAITHLNILLVSFSLVTGHAQGAEQQVSGTEDPVVNTIQVASHACPSGQGLRCADRQGSCMIGGLGLQNGIGPLKMPLQCWQCPYDPPFLLSGAGEYAGPARFQRIPEYRLRTGDVLQLLFTVVPLKSAGDYQLNVGDELLIESIADPDIKQGSMEKGLTIQPDGTITLRMIGQIPAAGHSIAELRQVIDEQYKKYYDDPSIDVTPVKTGTDVQRLREALSGSGGFNPQEVLQTISPSGEIRLPRIGSVQAHGLTIEELKAEINARYDEYVGGMEVEPSLEREAPHYVYVLGEVNEPGRFEMDAPTTVLGAIALAGGDVVGGNLRQVVVFRRGENFELYSTLLDVRAPVLGREAHPCDEIWVRDGDVIVIPRLPIKVLNNFVRMVFTEGIYGVMPFSTIYNLTPGG